MNDGILRRILSTPHNIVMDLNSVLGQDMSLKPQDEFIDIP